MHKSAIILQGYRKQIVDKEKTFQELAGEFSDCSSAKRGGDLGPFGRNQMQVNVLSIYGQRQTIMAKRI